MHSYERGNALAKEWGISIMGRACSRCTFGNANHSLLIQTEFIAVAATHKGSNSFCCIADSSDLRKRGNVGWLG